MRPASIAGLLLLVVGLFFLVRGGSFTTRKDVLDVGGLQVSATERRSITPWMSGIAIIAGVALLAGGLRSGTSKARF